MLLPLPGKIRRNVLLKIGASVSLAVLVGLAVPPLFRHAAFAWASEGLVLLQAMLAASVVVFGFLWWRQATRTQDQLLLALEKLANGDAEWQCPEEPPAGPWAHGVNSERAARMNRALRRLAESLRCAGNSEAEALAQLARERSRLEHLPLGLLTERYGHIIDCNAGLAQMFGYERSELLGLSSCLLLPREKLADREKILTAQARREGGYQGRVMELRRKDGQLFQVFLTGGVDSAGEAGVATWVCVDVGHVGTQELPGASRISEGSAHGGGRDSGTIPVMPVPLSPAQASCGRARPAATGGFPSSSSVQYGGEPPLHELGGVLEGIAILLSAKAEAKGLELVIDTGSDPALILIGDPLYLGQVLTTLASHAIRCSRQGEILLTVRECSRSAGMVKLQFGIHGQDIGLSPDQEARLCLDGAHGAGPMPRPLGGGDLDLAMCRQLVEGMGGRLWVESCSGEGGSFHFTAAFPSREAAAPMADRGAGSRFKAFVGRRVLVIDDSDSSRRVAANLLSSLGFHPETCASGQAAISQITGSGGPGYLFCCIDGAMPGESGVEVARRLRAHYGSTSPCPPLILMAACGHAASVQGISGEFAAVVSKPLAAGQLISQVARILHVAPEHGPAAVEGPGWPASGHLRGRRVLLIAPEERSREILADFLDEYGMRVRSVGDSLEVLQSVREEMPDCVLVECRQPALDASRIVSRLRELGYARLPIIGLADTLDGSIDREAWRAAGMSEVVERSLALSGLPATLARWMPPSSPMQAPDGPAGGRDPAGTAQSGRDGLPPLPPGLDVESGLKRLRGQKVLFLKALRIFRDSRGHQFQLEFRAAIVSEDWRTSERLARSLMKTAAHIGANDLSEAAARLEIAIRTGNYEGVPLLLAEVNRKLRIIVEGLSHIG